MFSQFSYHRFPFRFACEKQQQQQDRPLKPVIAGRGGCNPDVTGSDDSNGRDSCGGPKRGTCTSNGMCECLEGWTGPHCLASVGYDDIIWDVSDSIADVGFVLPNFVPKGLLVGFIGLFVLLFISVQGRKKMEGWSPIPDVDTKFRV